MKKTIKRINETQLRSIIVESILNEYNRWFQTEKNNNKQIDNLINTINSDLQRINELLPQQVWDLVRRVGYLDHSSFKNDATKYKEFSDEMLSKEDYLLNKKIYRAKEYAIIELIKYYLKKNWDVSIHEEGNEVFFRDPVTNVRQISFHFNVANINHYAWGPLTNIKNDNGIWELDMKMILVMKVIGLTIKPHKRNYNLQNKIS